MKYALYARKSSEDSGKQIQSIENQIQVLKDKAQRDGLKIVKIYQESKSAKDPYKREQFNQMIADMQDGVIDGIICWKLDRLSRNPIDGGTIQHYLLQGLIKEIVTYEKTYYPSDSSIMMSVELGMAVEYSQALGKNVKRGQSFKITKGNYPNKAPLGYINTIDRLKGEKEVIPDPDRYDLVRKLWDMLLYEDIAAPEVLKKANVMGLRVPGTRNKPERKLSLSGLYTLFRNPFYSGEFRWSGETHKGNHQPMITHEEFEKAERIISDRVRPKKTKHSFAFTNLIKCGECGSWICAENKFKTRQDGSINHRVYYRCTHSKVDYDCKQLGIRQDELDKQFSELLETLTVADEYIGWASDLLRQETEEATVKVKSSRSQQTKQLEKLDDKIQDLVGMKLEKLIDKETFQVKKAALTAEKQQLEEYMRLDTVSHDYKIDKIIEVFEFSKEAKRIFDNGNVESKKLILRILGSPLFLKDKKLSVEFNKVFEVIQNGNKAGITTNPTYATLETRINTNQSASEQALIKNGGGGEELPLASKSFQR